jgi:hypothetical protein
MAFTAVVEPAFQNVRLDYNVPAQAATVTISRTGPSGVTAAVRAWSNQPVTPGVAIIARDWEPPIGVPLVYTVVAKNSAGATLDTQTVTVTVPSAGCYDTWLNDLARVNNTIRVVIEQIPELDYQIPTSTHEVIRRRVPIVTSDVAHTPSLEASVLTATLDERDRARDALGNGVPILLRTPPDLGVGNMYLAVLEFKEQRISTLGAVADRRFVITGRQVDRPDPDLFAPVGGVTYQEVKDTFAAYTDLRAQRANYDAVLYGWGGTEPDDVVPWPPVDV